MIHVFWIKSSAEFNHHKNSSILQITYKIHQFQEITSTILLPKLYRECFEYTSIYEGKRPME